MRDGTRRKWNLRGKGHARDKIRRGTREGWETRGIRYAGERARGGTREGWDTFRAYFPSHAGENDYASSESCRLALCVNRTQIISTKRMRQCSHTECSRRITANVGIGD